MIMTPGGNCPVATVQFQGSPDFTNWASFFRLEVVKSPSERTTVPTKQNAL
jgi:hypothetical protein